MIYVIINFLRLLINSDLMPNFISFNWEENNFKHYHYGSCDINSICGRLYFDSF